MHIDRRQLLKGVALLTSSVAFPSWVYAQDRAATQIKVAILGELPTLDVMLSPVVLVNTVTQHIFDTLFSFDSQWQPQPLLAEGLPDISEDGLRYEISLRRNVKFHNGKDLTSEDVIASLKRWLSVNSRGRETSKYVSDVASAGDHRVTIELSARYSPLLSALCNYAVIMPAEAVQETLEEFVGTGPFALKERRPDQYIHLVKFEEYSSPAGVSDNYAGQREALAEELLFFPVPDSNTRVEGLLAGEYDYADSLPNSVLARLQASDRVAPVVLEGGGWISLYMNTRTGALANRQRRHAVQLALNSADMMAAAFDDPAFFTADSAFFPEGYVWHTENGATGFGVGDAAAARRELEASGYAQEPIRILTSRQYEFHYKLAQVAQVYLEAAGFVVDLVVVDWATLSSRRGDPEQWEMFITHSFFPSDPSMLNVLSEDFPGWYSSAEKSAALDAYIEAVSFEEQFQAWAALQKQIFDDAAIFKVGNFNVLSGASRNLVGLTPGFWPYFWNVSLTDA